ncbi:hypothetical protein HYR54_05400 [Candidatus Acetothermia bacterium]|nr:hypothetical protein [Candidatus Acetothermia bacterium]
MMTVTDISQRFAISSWQTYRLLQSIRPVLGDLCQSTKGRQLILNPEAIFIVERAIQLNRGGVALKALPERIKAELHRNIEVRPDPDNSVAPQSTKDAPNTEMLELIREQLTTKDQLITKQQQQITELLSQLRDLQEKVPALPVPDGRQESKRIGRWQALRMLITGQ